MVNIFTSVALYDVVLFKKATCHQNGCNRFFKKDFPKLHECFGSKNKIWHKDEKWDESKALFSSLFLLYSLNIWLIND